MSAAVEALLQVLPRSGPRARRSPQDPLLMAFGVAAGLVTGIVLAGT